MDPINPNESNVNPDDNVQRRYNDRVLGTLSLALGIVTLITGFVPCINWLSLIPGAIGLAVGTWGAISSRRAGTSAKMSAWGIAANVVGILGFLVQNLLINTPTQDQTIEP